MIAVYQLLLHKQLNTDTSKLFTLSTTIATITEVIISNCSNYKSQVEFDSIIRAINHWSNLPDC